MNFHSHLHFGMALQRRGNFECAFRLSSGLSRNQRPVGLRSDEVSSRYHSITDPAQVRPPPKTTIRM